MKNILKKRRKEVVKIVVSESGQILLRGAK
jgi:hypothetical protein